MFPCVRTFNLSDFEMVAEIIDRYMKNRQHNGFQLILIHYHVTTLNPKL